MIRNFQLSAIFLSCFPLCFYLLLVLEPFYTQQILVISPVTFLPFFSPWKPFCSINPLWLWGLPHPHFIFWDSISNKPGAFWFSLSSWQGSSRDPPVSFCPVLELQTNTPTPSFYRSARHPYLNIHVCVASTFIVWATSSVPRNNPLKLWFDLMNCKSLDVESQM